MKMQINEKIYRLSLETPSPLYIVGGYVRNFLIDGTLSDDVDLAGAVKSERLLPLLEKNGFTVKAQYKRTKTLIFEDESAKYEYTEFRKDSYFNGGHSPENVYSVDNAQQDCFRRDFTCNAVYYDVKNDDFLDPTGRGIADINNRILDTPRESDQVFAEDGLRLMRLCRFCGELGFTPTQRVILGAQNYSDNITDISAERIFSELTKILWADAKYPFSPVDGHYRGLYLLDKIGVLGKILPEIALGKGMAQRADFHNYDVLTHTLKCVLYAPQTVRLSALLHDVGKPYCMNVYGKYHAHAEEGEIIARNILQRLKASKAVTDETCFLVKNHMLDLDLQMKESKIRLFIVKNLPLINKLLDLKQADYTACKDDLSIPPSVQKWRAIYTQMLTDGTPFSIKELKISAADCTDLGITGKRIGEILNKTFTECVKEPRLNDRERLLKFLKRVDKA